MAGGLCQGDAALEDFLASPFDPTFWKGEFGALASHVYSISPVVHV
jgi:hypothetical protein